VNTALTPRNNGPQFLGPPVQYITVGQEVDLSFGAYDPDGDSLAYALGNCYTDSGMAVTYNSTYTYQQPFGVSWNVTIDPTTGLVHIAPIPGMPQIIVGVICVHVTEYRNGVEMGHTVRDVQMIVIPNPLQNDVPVVSPISNVSSNALVSGDEIFMCSPGPLTFDITGSDSSAGQAMLLGWSHNIPTATFTQVGNPSVQDTIPGTTANPPAGHFSFTPPGFGHYYVRFILTDDQCPVLGISERNIAIHVGSGPPQVSVTVGTCPDVSFSASGCGLGPISYAWSGAGGLSSSTSSFSYTYPGPGTYAWELIVSSPYHTDTVRDSVVVPPLSYQGFLTGIHYVAPCVGNTHDTIDAGGGWLGYSWSTGATTQAIDVFLGGYYGVTVEDANGCRYHDSIQLHWAEPDIYGVVTTSLGGPLMNQKILLVEHDTLLQTLWAADSTVTDSSGYYYFCNVTDSLVFLKATPLAFDYPNEMPTYADTTLYWNNAIAFQPIGNIPFQHDFATLPGTNPGGPGFIGGFVYQGANKTGAVGDPVPDLKLFLRNKATGAILGYRVTNPFGYFSFVGVPLAEYELVPDRVNVSTSNVPTLTLTAQVPSMDSLTLHLHRYWLELVANPTGIDGGRPAFSYTVAPNPFTQFMEVEVVLEEDAPVQWELYDAMGKVVARMETAAWKAGRHRFQVGESLAAGCYFFRLQAGGNTRMTKVLALER
jgi:hypothetical protein